MLSPSDRLVYPMFVCEDSGWYEEELPSMPGQFKYSITALVAKLEGLSKMGLRAVLLFPSLSGGEEKDERASLADHPEKSVIIKAIKAVKKALPNLCIIADVCLCSYTSHGHCGILLSSSSNSPSPVFDNEKSVRRLAEISVAYAKAGCDVIAPSDMMDGRILAIKQALHQENLSDRVAVLSYSAKFASHLYGPFRDVCNNAPSSSSSTTTTTTTETTKKNAITRSTYQLPPGSRGLAMRALSRDILDEGADMAMVKPGIFYLDIVREAKNAFPNHPLALYQVSGEYAMIVSYTSNNGNIDQMLGNEALKNIVFESFTASTRAGATIFISYFTPFLLKWLKE